MVEIPWEDQLSYYSSSVNGSLRGKKLRNTNRNGRISEELECTVFLCAAFVFPLPRALCNALTLCQVQHSTNQVILQRNWTTDEMILPCAPVGAHTLKCPSTALQSFSRFAKNIFYSFRNNFFFPWDMVHFQPNVSLILGKDILRCFT